MLQIILIVTSGSKAIIIFKTKGPVYCAQCRYMGWGPHFIMADLLFSLALNRSRGGATIFAFVKLEFLISEVSFMHSITSSWLRISDASLFVSISTSSIAPSHFTCLAGQVVVPLVNSISILSFYCFQSWTDSPCLITKSNLKTKKE